MHSFTSFPWEGGTLSPPSSENASSMSNCSSASPCSTTDLLLQVESGNVDRTRPMKKIKNVRKSSTLKCVVCGDKPTGYHYDVLSCNGCKTFFRRTVISNRKFACSRGGKCAFTKGKRVQKEVMSWTGYFAADFRCACRSCRFEKCVHVGMNPKAIQFPMDPETSKNDPSDDEVEIVDKYEEALGLLGRLLYVEDCCDRLRVSNVPLNYHETVDDVLNKPSLVESSNTYKKLDTFYDKDLPTTKRWMIVDCLLAIEYAKAFDAFSRLCRKDQMALIRHVSFVITGLSQAYSSYEKNLDIVTFPDGSCPLLEGPQRGIPHLTVTDVALKDTYRRPIAPLKRIEISRKQYVFLKAIMLFTPNSDEMSPEAVEVVDGERSKYCSALHRILARELGELEGTKKYGEILTVSEAFVRFSDNRREKINICSLMTPMTLSAIGQVVVLQRDNASLDAVRVVFEKRASAIQAFSTKAQFSGMRKQRSLLSLDDPIVVNALQGLPSGAPGSSSVIASAQNAASPEFRNLNENKPGEPAFQMSMTPELKIAFRSNNLCGQAITVPATIINTTPLLQAFKVKTTSNDIFRVSPPLGIIRAGEAIPLSITFSGPTKPEPNKHFFAIHHMHVSPEDACKPARDLWTASARPDGVKRIAASFENEDGSPHAL
ncbi:hypothetical protein QR680_018830 [Steinernema hermaphroditum]|uniref:Nuclear receptor domain-containing protein n=1 Tax=Steinernema hermaphroditum TaxID=289476 RepID=A0AA39HLE1_9BILA|nr:hypothetical protein QR680_018830 [Steinernema hermaphroditum]